ncbi:SDR family oxidoreductase [Oleiagrimonas soli]|uniref:NAD(P)-dependent dehydrogenase (Short-subunit alcohol dehydrogenase family) n=1 Tax=Oleiagrimonas soli TaxID=1543381 RepID=A0A099CWS3_9GAMM|nr:SDR family oxidoreductase [Oleiagrimonas soli]KGI78077.1 short-chain dehydrogenase [Oleiagrimonas soli]MBB6183507.1 NAD(P)-dependent dehydrogenase (short-subunit alcohol dehydrogenase family) [Oleiagrimonas soli]
MSFPLQGKTALVTGANRGIGEAIVDALVASGIGKVYAAARNTDDLADLLQRHGDVVVPLPLDVTDPKQVEAAAAKASDTQLLVNNAGFAGHAGGTYTDAAWIESGRREMEVNFFGTFQLTQAFAPVLAANGGGAVVNIASVASLVSFPLLLAYSASKAAVHSLTQSTRLMLKSQGTQVFGVYPGPIDTRMAESIDMDKATPADAARAILEGIEGGVEEIFPDPTSQGMGQAFLASPKALEQQVSAMMDEAA